jgi:hypothetical protein
MAWYNLSSALGVGRWHQGKRALSLEVEREWKVKRWKLWEADSERPKARQALFSLFLINK